jgi:hypothetical protein
MRPKIIDFGALGRRPKYTPGLYVPQSTREAYDPVNWGREVSLGPGKGRREVGRRGAVDQERKYAKRRARMSAAAAADRDPGYKVVEGYMWGVSESDWSVETGLVI